MPSKTTQERARRDRAEGKAPTTQAGEYVREEMEHVKRGKHGAKSRKQAIAIGLSKARRSGVKIRPNPNKKRRSNRSAKRTTGRRSAPRRSAARSRSSAKGRSRKTRSSRARK